MSQEELALQIQAYEQLKAQYLRTNQVTSQSMKHEPLDMPKSDLSFDHGFGKFDTYVPS